MDISFALNNGLGRTPQMGKECISQISLERFDQLKDGVVGMPINVK